MYSFDVFVHLDLHVQWSYIKEIERMLKPGGKVFIHTADLTTSAGWNRFVRQSGYRVEGFYFMTPCKPAGWSAVAGGPERDHPGRRPLPRSTTAAQSERGHACPRRSARQPDIAEHLEALVVQTYPGRSEELSLRISPPAGLVSVIRRRGSPTSHLARFVMRSSVHYGAGQVRSLEPRPQLQSPAQLTSGDGRDRMGRTPSDDAAQAGGRSERACSEPTEAHADEDPRPQPGCGFLHLVLSRSPRMVLPRRLGLLDSARVP
ncbi:MAG: class I SAM-dependent methyltransferase [Actinomycetota bacterium]|nr:class I SAM-dependent methyltransferase [Actinomycetota bacterium]